LQGERRVFDLWIDGQGPIFKAYPIPETGGNVALAVIQARKRRGRSQKVSRGWFIRWNRNHEKKFFSQKIAIFSN
jgi:hypothetical protein